MSSRTAGAPSVDVSARRTVTHLAIDARLPERDALGLQDGTLRLDLTRVAWRAMHLVACYRLHPVEVRHDGSLGRAVVEHLPEIDPLAMQAVVLHRKHMNAAVRKAGCVGLLPLGADGVVDREALEAGFARNFEVVASIAHEHPCQQLPVSVEKPVVALEVTNHVLRRVRAEHARHAGAGPSIENVPMALRALFAAGV